MTPTASSAVAAMSKDVFAAATLHLEVLEEFIAVVRGKMETATDAFARDSLSDLLISLTEQRDTYQAFAIPMGEIIAA